MGSQIAKLRAENERLQKEKAEKLAAASAQSLNESGVKAFKENDCAKAEGLFAEASRLQPAENTYREAVRSLPGDAWLKGEVGRLLNELGFKALSENDYAKAGKVFAEASRLQPAENGSNSVFHFVRSRSKEKEGDLEGALEEMRKALWLRPDDAWWKLEVARLESLFRGPLSRAWWNFLSAQARRALAVAEMRTQQAG
uniref:Uncharacterized protein n=1 Tax=Chromera velia CCMP2878 TaxID=1169474 RepID=A0A0G4I1I6_9ALVE|eukprot:Cvel_10163.t1-p1 / transcript=Cvel_10163.t1 / gene=Cvel_10163 / organism=Chromera_velia_CCMP2878 / gene_product=hypothetical protein / transcript_product=hypothetical protein / location=Cvel_scaffold606:50135-53073(+) / protein_length=198 / sequence_SO=supercontig / SO=protein_coding / is_pseudo=false